MKRGGVCFGSPRHFHAIVVMAAVLLLMQDFLLAGFSNYETCQRKEKKRYFFVMQNIQCLDFYKNKNIKKQKKVFYYILLLQSVFLHYAIFTTYLLCGWDDVDAKMSWTHDIMCKKLAIILSTQLF